MTVMAEHPWCGNVFLGMLVGMLAGSCLLLLPSKWTMFSVAGVKELGRLQTAKSEAAEHHALQVPLLDRMPLPGGQKTEETAIAIGQALAGAAKTAGLSSVDAAKHAAAVAKSAGLPAAHQAVAAGEAAKRSGGSPTDAVSVIFSAARNASTNTAIDASLAAAVASTSTAIDTSLAAAISGSGDASLAASTSTLSQRPSVSAAAAEHSAASTSSEQATTATTIHHISLAGSSSETTTTSSDGHTSLPTSTTTVKRYRGDAAAGYNAVSTSLGQTTAVTTMHRIAGSTSSPKATTASNELHASSTTNTSTEEKRNSTNRTTRPYRNVFAFLCGHVTKQGGTAYFYRNLTLRMAKSIVLTHTTQYSSRRINVNLWLMVDEESGAALKPALEQIQQVGAGFGDGPSVSIKLIPISRLRKKYGAALDLFRPCASVNLFLHEVMPPDVTDVIVLGADQLVVDDLAKAWDDAQAMGWDGTKLLGSGEECVEPRTHCGWYHGGSPHKFFQNGMSSGTSMFSVKNMRAYRFSAWVLNAISRFPRLTLGDQDVFNRYAVENPHNVTLLQCNLNLRTDSGCNIKAKPPVVLHGNRYSFGRLPAWRAVAKWVDDTFELLRTQGPAALPAGTSIWDALDANGTSRRAAVMSTLGGAAGLTPRLEDVLTPPKGGRDCYGLCERMSLAAAADLSASDPSAKCPIWFPYKSKFGGKLCFTDENDARKGVTGSCSTWCTLDPDVGSGCGDNREQLCNRWLCPDDFPHQSDVLGGMNCFRKPPSKQDKWLIAHNNASMCFSHEWCTLRASIPPRCAHLYLEACVLSTTTTTTRSNDRHTTTNAASASAASTSTSEGRPCQRPCRDILTVACHPSRKESFKYRNQTIRLLKSIVMSQTTNYSNMAFDWTIWIMADSDSEATLKSAMPHMKDFAKGFHGGPSVNIKFLQIRSLEQRYGEAMHVVGRCATSHMFMHELLPSYVDEILMLRADQVVVADLAKIWDNAKDMSWDNSKLFGAVEECVEPRSKCGWYSVAPHKFFQNGLSAGTVLYSVKNMRARRFSAFFLTVISRYTKLKHGDQDVLNVYAIENPHNVTLLQCNFNVRPESGCDVKKQAPSILQGSHGEFLGTPAWIAVAKRIDSMFELLSTSGPDSLPKGASIWDALDANGQTDTIQVDFLKTLQRPVGLTPRLEDVLRPPQGGRGCYAICNRSSTSSSKPLTKCPGLFPHLSEFGGKLCFSAPADAKSGLALDCARWCTLDPEYGSGLCGDNRNQMCSGWACPADFPHQSKKLGGIECFKDEHPPAHPEPCFRKDWCALDGRLPARCEHLYLRACKPGEL